MTEPTDFLYPMVDHGVAVDHHVEVDRLLADLAHSAAEKMQASATITSEALEIHGPQLDAVADAIARRVETGGRLFTCGNGGSATDAEGMASLLRAPPDGRPIAARSLVADMAIVTALANDIGFDAVFARQVMAHGTDRDVLIGFSTSGNSTNVLEAFRAAHERGLLTVGLAGDTGGQMARSDHLDHCLVVAATSIHRIQEAQSALAFALWQRVQARLGTHPAAETNGGVR